MYYDTITCAGIERTLAAWGFTMESAALVRTNQESDMFSGTVMAQNITDAPAFAFESPVIIQTGRSSPDGSDNSFTGGTIKFQGKRIGCNINAAGSGLSYAYTFEGPWYDLKQTQYQQGYKGVAVNPYSPGECVMNSSIGSKAFPTTTLLYISVGDQLQDILQYIIDQYVLQGIAAPFQYTGRALHSTAVSPLAPTGQAIDLSSSGSPPTYNYHVVSNPTIDLPLFDVFLPTYVIKPLSCADAIKKELELSPRTTVAFDYTTTPPTVYIKSVDNYPGVNFTLFTGNNPVDGQCHVRSAIKSRDDMIARAVKLTFRISNTFNNSPVFDYIIDKWAAHGSNSSADPDGGLRVIVDTIDLAGYNIATTQANLDVEPLQCIGTTTAQKRAWWSSRRGGELDKVIDSSNRFQTSTPSTTGGVTTWTVTAASIPDATMTYASNGFDSTGAAVTAGQNLTTADLAFFTNRIVRGTHHSWMKLNPTTPVLSVKVRCRVSLTYIQYDAVMPGDTAGQLPINETLTNSTPGKDKPGGTGNRQYEYVQKDYHVEMELTNAPAGNNVYSTITSATPGEQYIIGNGGIAQYLYNALSVLQFEGEFTKIETAFSNNISILNRVNLINGAAAWLTMNAQVNSVREEYGTKTTTISLGPAKHLSAAQLNSILQMWRNRRTWYNPLVRSDNSQVNGGDVTMPETAGGGNTNDGVQDNKSARLFIAYTTPGDPTSAVKAIINLDPAVATVPYS